MFSPCLFNFSAENIMWNATLDEWQARIKIARRNNNLMHAEDIILMAEREEELKSLLMKMREWKSWLKIQPSKDEDHGIRSHHFMANRWGNNGNSDRLYFLGSKITANSDWNHEIKRRLLLGRKAMTNLDSVLKSRDITLPTKVHVVKAMVFPAIMYRCEIWAIKKTEHQRIDDFQLWWWRRLSRVPWRSWRLTSQS